MLLGQEVHYYMVYIAYFTELDLQICDYAQKRRICRENCKYALDENFHGHFCPRRKAAKFCHPGIYKNLFVFPLKLYHHVALLENFEIPEKHFKCQVPPRHAGTGLRKHLSPFGQDILVLDCDVWKCLI